MTKLKPSIDFGYPTEPHGNIPAFQDIEEEAEFWDTHDFTDYGDGEWTARKLDSSNFVELIPVPLDFEDHRAFVEQARERDVEPADLAAAWLRDRLRHELEKKAS